MKIAYNPSGASPLAGAPKNNNDIIFDLAGKAIYVKDVKLLGTDTVYDVFKKHTSSNGGGNVGLVPVPSYINTNTRFLREDGTWVVPTNTTYAVFTGSTLENSGKAGLVPAPSAGLKRLLLSDGTWTLKFLSYDIPANSAIKITFYSKTHATLFMRHTVANNMGVYHISGYGSYGDTKRISIVEVTNSCSGIIYPVDGEFAVIIKNPETTHTLFVSATLLLGSISKIETVTSEVTKSDIWRNVLHSANAFIKNGTININGVSITPLTQHLSLSNYVTLDTALVITGYKDFTRQVKISTAGNPLKLTSSTTYCDIGFSITNSDGTTVGSGIVLRGNADFKIFDAGWSNEYTILHSNNYTLYKHSYTNLTGSGTTANLAIVSTGTANGWTLKTLGSNAFDSTKYLPLTGGTLSGDLNFSHLNSVVKGYITWTGGTILQRIQISDNNNTNDAVFTFLLSTNSGTDWTDLFTIKDNGSVVATTFLGNAASADKVANNLILKINSGTTEGTNQYTYNGSATKVLTINTGSGIGFTNDAGSLSIHNAGVRSITTGTSNGTISVNTNGTSTNVAVKGLGSAAFTKSGSYIQQVTVSKPDDILDLYTKIKDYIGTTNIVAVRANFVNLGLGWGHLLLRTLNSLYNKEYEIQGSGLYLGGGGLHHIVTNGGTNEGDAITFDKYLLYDSGNSSLLGGGSTWGSSLTVKLGSTSKTLTLPTTFNWDNITNKPTSYTPSSHSHPTNQITALTGYSKATSAADLATTDTLNAALGKLEYKAATTYSWYKSITDDDTDDIVNKWSEIVGFLDSVKEGTDILDEFVTRKTNLTITGLKLFNTSTNTLPLLIARGGNGESEVLKIGIDDHNATFEYVNDETSNSFLFKLVNTDIENGGEGINANSSLVKFYGGAEGSVVIANKFMGQLDKTLTFAAGAFIAKTYNNNTAVTVNIPTHTSHLTNNSGFLTLHQSLANYVTLDTNQTITGAKTFTKIIYGNAYNYNENKAGAYLVLNKGGNYLGIGASSSNIQAIVIGESDLSGTWIKEHVTIDTSGHVKATKFIGVSKSGDWYSGRDRATFKTAGYSWGYSPTLSIKTTNGSWELGTFDKSDFIDNLIFSYVTDSDYNSDTNESIRIKLPYTKSGTIALTSDITKAAVGLDNVLNTAFYARTATVNGINYEIAGTISGATFSIYSPITAGTSGLILVSNGSGAPVWKTATLLTVGTALKLQSGGGNNKNQTSLVYYKFASYTSEDITLQINLNAFFYVTQYYNSHNFGLLRAEVRFNNNGTSPDAGKFRIEWLVNSGIDPNSVQMSYLVSGNTRTINIYHKLTTTTWDSFKVIKLSDGAWSSENGTDWELHRDVQLTSLPTDEIFTKSVNVDIANTAAPVEYGLLNLCIRVSAGSSTSVTNNVLTTSGVNADTWFKLILSEPLEVDLYYTLGFYVENVPLSATLWSFRVGNQSNTNWVINITLNGWVWATGYYNSNGNSLELLIDDFSRNFYDSIKISKIVLVKGKLKAYYSPAPINLSNYTSYLGYIGTTKVQASSAAQALTGISSATISGVTSTNTLTISNTGATGHINFSRGSYNYITMPSGGSLYILPNGSGVSASNGMVFSSNGLHPATNLAYSLGTSSLKWNLVHTNTLISTSCQSVFIELNASGGLSNYGGFIDFHFHNSDGKPTDNLGNVVETAPDYTSRIIENSAGTLNINGVTFKNGLVASTGFMKLGSSDSYILLGGGSHKAVSDFLLKSELGNLELNSNLCKKDISLKPTTLWADVGDLGTLFTNPHPGTYAILVYCPRHKEGTTNRYHVYYSGIISINDNTNTTDTSDEIWLHASAHASHIRIYLRTITLTGAKYPKLLIAASANFAEAVTFNFKIKRLI